MTLQAALEARFFPHVESMGFTRDRKQEPRITCFRRPSASSMQVLALVWGTRGPPGFSVQFTEAPLEGIDYSGSHLTAEEIFPGNFALLRGWLIPERGQRVFHLQRSLWRRLVVRQGDDPGPLVEQLMELFPELEAWWRDKTKGAHLILLPPLPPRPVPDHAPVFGCPVKPSLLQKMFARENLWPIGFFGTAVVVDLALAIQGADLGQMLALVVVGALGGFLASWILFKVCWHIRVWINGGPFHQGDLVQVIAGPHAGRIVAVYEEWASRSQVRVDLGEAEWKAVQDVFSYVQVCRVKRAPAPVSPIARRI